MCLEIIAAIGAGVWALKKVGEAIAEDAEAKQASCDHHMVGSRCISCGYEEPSDEVNYG